MEIKNYYYPFHHIVIDNFLKPDVAKAIASEFPSYDSEKWYQYNSPLEKKKTIREWGMFPSNTYKLFSELCGNRFVDFIKELTKCEYLLPDYGLHGAGWHIHKTGDHLNIHLDYSIHPFLKLQRKYNLIVYMNEDWEEDWGGDLEFWTHNVLSNKPRDKVVKIKPLFNRAVLFDTTQNSWHGFSEKLKCPDNVYRKSIAMYYLTNVSLNASTRTRALYAPLKEQEEDQQILDLIRQRSK